MIKAVIFDMDGVMFDTEVLSATSLIRAAKEQDVEMTYEEAYLTLGFNKKRSYNFYLEYYKEKAPNLDIKKMQERHTELMDEVLYTVGPEKKYYIEELLRYLKDNNLKIGIASSSSTEHIKSNIQKTKLEKYIDKVTSGSEVINSKPDPEIYLLAASRLEVKPEECIVIEDSKSGLTAGFKAGMNTMMVIDQFKPDEEVKSMIKIIKNNLEEIKLEIEKIIKK